MNVFQTLNLKSIDIHRNGGREGGCSGRRLAYKGVHLSIIHNKLQVIMLMSALRAVSQMYTQTQQ
jgi:hypothetical protein